MLNFSNRLCAFGLALGAVVAVLSPVGRALAPADAHAAPDRGFGGVQGDECDFPLPLGCNSTVMADLTLMTSNPADPVYPCRVPSPGRGVNTIWYQFTAGGPTATLTTGIVSGGGANDTLLAVYSGSCSNLTQIACNDDISGSNLLSSVSLTNLVKNQTYFVQLSAYSAQRVGVYSLNLDCRPPNDECTGAINLTCNSSVDFNLGICTTNPADPIFPCFIPNPTTKGVNSAWFRFIAQTPDIRLTVLAANGIPSQNTLMQAFIGTGCGALSLFACNDNFDASGRSQLIFTNITLGREFWVEVAAADAASVNDYRLLLECNPDCATCPQGAVQDMDICGFNDVNGLCSNGQPIPCNSANICGTVSKAQANGPNDLDFYTFTLSGRSIVNWCVVSPQRLGIAITNSPFCPGGSPAPIAYAATTAESCQAACISAVLEPGTYSVAIEQRSGSATCGGGNNYTGTFSTSLYCEGDVNFDNRVDTADLTRFLGTFGSAPFSLCSPFDLVPDGTIDTRDLVRFLARFGALCLPPPPPPKP